MDNTANGSTNYTFLFPFAQFISLKVTIFMHCNLIAVNFKLFNLSIRRIELYAL